ncbi:MAG: SOS response-associated peptidase family protein [Gracilimonas sp.]|nr:SOS response-associated peptidase family protein [Gracilimonas sp.]
MKRYVLEADKFEINEAFGVKSESEIMYEPNFNVIPGSTMPIIIREGDERDIVKSVWGLKFKDSEHEITELKHEEISANDHVYQLLNNSACIIPISGFYKWKESVKDPLPFYLRIITHDVTGVAGVFNTYKNNKGRTIHTFAILSMPANPLVEPLDDRMPVILDQKDFGRWLHNGAADMVKSGFSGNHLLPDMTVFRVPELVNDPSNNTKELIQPIPKLRNYDGADE